MINMKAVAKAAGVSTMTVSRVINTPDKVKEATRNKVLAAMNELGFQPNHAAKALVSNQTRTIHIFIPSRMGTEDPYLMRFLAGASDELSTSYYSFLIRREWDFPYKCDGIIAMGLDEGDDLKLQQLNVPVVLFGKTDLNIDWVDVNNFTGTYTTTNYLIEKGHRKIGFLGIHTNEHFASERLVGYHEAMSSAKIVVNSHWIKQCEHSEEAAYENAVELFKYTDITALVCSSDLLAMGAIRAARSLGKQVPEDLSITGFDGTFLDLLTDPKLTTVQQPVYEIGKELACQLLKRIKNPNIPLLKKQIELVFIERKSVEKYSDA